MAVGATERDCGKLLFILVYFRLYLTQEVQGFLFGIGQPQANEWVHKLSGVLNQASRYEKQLPERDARKLEAILNERPALEFVIDGTDRRIDRPHDKERRNKYYSGKQIALHFLNRIQPKVHQNEQELVTIRL